MKKMIFFVAVCLLTVSGCKKDDGGPTGDGGSNTAQFEFIAGRSWTYSGQSYETNGTPIPNTTANSSLAIQTTGQTIGGVANAAVMRMTYTQGTHSESTNLTVAYNEDKFMIYNGTTGNPNESPSLPGWTALFDFKKVASVRSLLSFDSTYQIAMHSGQILNDRVRYNATMRYLGEEAVSAFNTPNIACSKYQFTFTYDAVIDTGGIVLYSGNVITATTTIWFAPSIGFVKIRGDGAALFHGRFNDLSNLKIYHDVTAHSHYSPGVSYYFIDFGGGSGFEYFYVNAGTGSQAGYSIFDGFSKNF